MVSQIGDRFTQMAFIELLGKEFFGSFAAFGGIAVVFTLPSIILGPIAGPVIDSWRKKRVLVVSDLIRGILILSLPFVYSISREGTGGLFAMLGVALVVYVFGFFFSSARLAFIPLIVPRKLFLQANSANMTILRAATGIGTVLGGVAVHFIGWELGFIVDAITYFVSFVLILFVVVSREGDVDIRRAVIEKMSTYRSRAMKFLDFIPNKLNLIFNNLMTLPSFYINEFIKNEFKRVEPRTRKQVNLKKEVTAYIKNIKDGVKLMSGTRMMIFVMVSILVLFLISGVAFTVLVPTIQQTLQLGTLGVTVLALAVAGGMFLGPFFTGIFGTAYPKQKIMIVSYFSIGLLFAGSGITYVSIGLERVLATPWIHWTLIGIMGVVLFAAGVLFSAITISQDTLIQERVPHRSRGRLFAWREALASFAFVSTAVPAGIIADAVSFEYVLVAVGVLVALFAVAWIPFLWRSDQTDVSIINGG